ncbi:MAG: ribose 5-phosphate isomerase A [Candidatus Diapherotrites archaeon]
MALQEKHIEDFVAKFVKDGDVVSIGTSNAGEAFLKKLALALEDEKVPINHIKFVPTSLKMASIASSLKMPMTSLDEFEIDIGIEFVDQVDESFNYIKRDSCSLVRDKMIAQSAAVLVVITEEKNLVKKLRGRIPFEVAPFGWKRTLIQLEAFGKAKLREEGGKPVKTESNNYLIDVDIDEIYDLDELEMKSKEIPGVLETGLFIGYADRIVLHGKNITVKSRMEFKQ